jgi:hypothetical protein
MQVISSGGIPLCLAFFVRGLRLRKPWWLFGAWLVAGWQLSLGFALGLPLAYLLAGWVLVAALVWVARGRPPLNRRLMVGGAAGLVVFVAVAGLIARPYFRVADDNPEAKRPPSTVEAFSGPAKVFLTAPDENFVWADATSRFRDDLENVPEKTLFPGALILVLAVAGLWSSSFDRRLRIGLAVAVLAISVLALGFREADGLLWPYRVLYDVLPGWDAIRTPGRLVTFSSLALALLAAAGAEVLFRAVRRWFAGRSFDVGPRWPGRVIGALAVLLVAGVVVEGRGLPFDPLDDQDQPAVPYPPGPTAEVAAPQLHLPAERAEDSRRYLLWSTDGFPKIVNGRASTEPNLVEDTIDAMDGFPDPPSVALLRELGVRSVILHTDRTAGTPQAHAASAPIAGLPLRRERLRGGLLAYLIRSPRAGSGPSGGSATGSGGGVSSPAP